MAHRISKFKKELAALNPKELRARLREVESNFFQLQMQFKTGQLANTSLLSLTRKEMARIHTALTAKSGDEVKRGR